MVILGAYAGLPRDDLRETAFAAVPHVVKKSQLVELNRKAVEAGFEHGQRPATAEIPPGKGLPGPSPLNFPRKSLKQQEGFFFPRVSACGRSRVMGCPACEKNLLGVGEFIFSIGFD